MFFIPLKRQHCLNLNAQKILPFAAEGIVYFGNIIISSAIPHKNNNNNNNIISKNRCVIPS